MYLGGSLSVDNIALCGGHGGGDGTGYGSDEGRHPVQVVNAAAGGRGG